MDKKGKDLKVSIRTLIRKTGRITKEVVEGFKKGYKETSKDRRRKGDG